MFVAFFGGIFPVLYFERLMIYRCVGEGMRIWTWNGEDEGSWYKTGREGERGAEMKIICYFSGVTSGSLYVRDYLQLNKSGTISVKV